MFTLAQTRDIHVLGLVVNGFHNTIHMHEEIVGNDIMSQPVLLQVCTLGNCILTFFKNDGLLLS